jgi:vacuolar-type H+-ATPase subunit B/Vma2
MLLVKLNAIAEGRLLIHDIQITSKMSDGVSCLHSIEENTGPFSNKGWWRENNLKIINKMIKSKKKIVKLTKSVNNWDELSLNWKDKKVTSDASEILYASFEKVDK